MTVVMNWFKRNSIHDKEQRSNVAFQTVAVSPRQVASQGSDQGWEKETLEQTVGQIVMNPSNAIASSGSYDEARFYAGNIFDSQKGDILETSQIGYWLSSEGGPEQPFITVDLEAGFIITTVEFFNTHNAFYNDRGTGRFNLLASNEIDDQKRLVAGWVLISGELAQVHVSENPMVAQPYSCAFPGRVRYLEFRPCGLAAFADSTRPNRGYGLNEMRLYGIR